MSALDDVISQLALRSRGLSTAQRARAELAQLRAAAAWHFQIDEVSE